jgi:hypothetical protein
LLPARQNEPNAGQQLLHSRQKEPNVGQLWVFGIKKTPARQACGGSYKIYRPGERAVLLTSPKPWRRFRLCLQLLCP